ncbi:hypothetical protein [Paenibacillus lautus]|uniref:hypothetical protein n=1 Tax=Paenibacillus lautus TaxID=1401 RepID=UPI001C7DA0F1|nr:hypothetical protein [Paenibacillus lautus]MBX4152383.1 hypothetical protein [Paenibacillus lautus]
MADYDCEWCNNEDVCKYSYMETSCIPLKQIELANKITQDEVVGYKALVEDMVSRDEDIFYEVINAYRNIINGYPTKEEVTYAKEITG